MGQGGSFCCYITCRSARGLVWLWGFQLGTGLLRQVPGQVRGDWGLGPGNGCRQSGRHGSAYELGIESKNWLFREAGQFLVEARARPCRGWD
ncbi:unnamed protein product [Prunus armeniaca]|uniref:Uncharacterized protein n=1 Tax=Prunus armeniaca TaxID=36596 RepID=A0A6J5VUP8_PRUAR|nr:unnamed protein product [Prunus armeniaca]